MGKIVNRPHRFVFLADETRCPTSSSQTNEWPHADIFRPEPGITVQQPKCSKATFHGCDPVFPFRVGVFPISLRHVACSTYLSEQVSAMVFAFSSPVKSNSLPVAKNPVTLCLHVDQVVGPGQQAEITFDESAHPGIESNARIGAAQ